MTAECAAAMGPVPFGEFVLVVEATAEAGGAKLTVRATGSAEVRVRLSAWMDAARQVVEPWHIPPELVASPLGRVLAGSLGDFEVDNGPEATVLKVTASPNRVARMVADLVSSALHGCAVASPAGGAR